VQLGIQGALLLDGDATALAALATWETGAESSLARSLAAGAVGLACCAVSLGRTSRSARLCGGAAGALASMSFALSGHAATLQPG
jgi:hypothetical protein